MSDLREAVMQRLAKVRGIDRTGDLVSLGLVSGVSINDDEVFVSIAIPPERAGELEPLRAAVERSVGSLDGVRRVVAVLTAERAADSDAAARPSTPTGSPFAGASSQPAASSRAAVEAPKPGVAGIGAIIAVASGKGGVGKSTTAVNLALALQAEGRRVGILDADIYGPSVPRMLGLKDKPSAQGKVLRPLEGYGLRAMSMGFLVEEDTPMIWRGPMVISAITQMLREVDWSHGGAEPLDILVVDMPPGTGDAQLTMAQQVPLAGAVIVSTPQDIALIDARKGLNMFRKVDVPILGLIENMSTFVCPHCGERSDIFGHGGAEEEATRLGLPYLGGVPLHMDIRTHSDAGTPVMVSMPQSRHAEIYRSIAEKIRRRLDAEPIGHAPPRIVID